jgi:tetratricopeptide (TPR) repeat protein
MKRNPLKRMRENRGNLLAAGLFAALGIAAAPPLHAADPFHADLLRDGVHASDRGDHATAARYIRLACFGMLDEPKLLGECLTRLALAQDKAGDKAGFRETFGRLVEIEERFQGYSQANLPAEVRTALTQRLATHIPAPTLASSPAAFRGAAGRAAAPDAQATKPRIDKPQPIERSTQPQTQPQAQPQRQPAAPPPAQVSNPPANPSVAPRSVTDAERTKLESARKLLGETGKVRELREAFQLAREVADAHPEMRDVQQLAGEAAYRISRWSEAAEYLGRAGGPADEQPELLFYLAVALYESGAPQTAAGPLRRALPNLQRTPYVDGYAKKILGQ